MGSIPSIRVAVSIEMEAARYLEQERNGNKRGGGRSRKRIPFPPLFIAEKKKDKNSRSEQNDFI